MPVLRQETAPHLHQIGQQIEECKGDEDIVHFLAREVKKTVIALEEDVRKEVVHRHSKGLEHAVGVSTQSFKQARVDMPRDNEHNAKPLHQVDEGQPLGLSVTLCHSCNA